MDSGTDSLVSIVKYNVRASDGAAKKGTRSLKGGVVWRHRISLRGQPENKANAKRQKPQERFTDLSARSLRLDHSLLLRRTFPFLAADTYALLDPSNSNAFH